MHIRNLIIIVLLVCMPGAQAQDKSPTSISFQLGWHVTIDAGGRVTQMSPIENKRIDRFPQIRQRLEQAIRVWHFLPGDVNGKPAVTQTGLHVRAELLPQPDKSFRIRIVYAGVGGTIRQLHIPRYPGSAMKRHKSGEVVLRVAYDAQGKVISAALAPDSPKVDQSLINASLLAAREWTFQPEIVGGHPIAGVAITPLCYRLHAWGSSHRRGKCNWTPPGESRPLHPGEALALNPAARLTSEVAGRVL